MFRKKTPVQGITQAQKDEIILEYLNTVAAAYKDQAVTAEFMIENEIKILNNNGPLNVTSR